MKEKRLGGPWYDKSGKYHSSTQVSPKINIFENSYFGKPYKTRDGRKALYLYDYKCWIENDKDYTEYYPDGKWFQANIEHCLDIISEWQESIDEKELDELAYEYVSKAPQSGEGYEYQGEWIWEDMVDAYKAGYRKAKEE